jgi:hypothetical protein
MMKTALASRLGHGGGLLEEKIHIARLAEAERLAATQRMQDAALLRLQVLRDELVPAFAAYPLTRGIVDLSLVPGDPARLWIDMTCYVVMAPDPSTYRLQRDGLLRQETLMQSSSREEIIASVMQHVAHHLVAREKQIRLMAELEEDSATVPSSTPLLLAWLSGLTIGISLMAGVLGWMVR